MIELAFKCESMLLPGLLDSGASINIMPLHTAKQLGPTIRPEEISIKGVNSTGRSCGRILAHCKFGHLTTRQEFVVLDGAPRILLGMPVLNALNLTDSLLNQLDQAGVQVAFSLEVFSIFSAEVDDGTRQYHETEDPEVPIFLEGAVKIKPHSAMAVNINTGKIKLDQNSVYARG